MSNTSIKEDLTKTLSRFPDILYSQSNDGEIVIEWDENSNKLSLITYIDISGFNQPMSSSNLDYYNLPPLVKRLTHINHPNLLNMTGDTLTMLDDIETLAFRTEAPDHISTWK